MSYLTYEVFPAKEAEGWIRPTYRKYPWRTMKVGEAFFVPCLPLHYGCIKDRIYGACWHFARANKVPMKVSIKHANRNGELGLLVERVA